MFKPKKPHIFSIFTLQNKASTKSDNLSPLIIKRLLTRSSFAFIS